MIAIKQRILAMDAIRAFSIVAVIFIHVTGLMLSYSTFNTKIYMQSLILNQLARFSVPAFIALSGIGISISYKKEQGYFKFLGHRLYKVVPRYIVWCIIYVYIIKKSLPLGLLTNDIICGTAFYHLYFVPLIVEFYIIFPFVYRFIGSKSSLVLNFVITMAILIGLHSYVFPVALENFFDRKNMLDWIFYFSFGAFIGNNLNVFIEKVRKFRRIIFMVSVLVFSGFICEVILNTRMIRNLDYTTTFLRPSVVAYSMMFIIFIFSINWKNNVFMKIIQYISKASYGIYLSHAFVLYYFTKYYTDNLLHVNSIGFGIKGFLAAFLGGIIINQVRKLP